MRPVLIAETELTELLGEPDASTLTKERRDALAAAGAFEDGQLGDALAAIGAPVCDLLLERGDRCGRGWVDGEMAALLVPAGADPLRQLIAVPTGFLPDALARLNDVGPRPRIEPALRLRLAPGALAGILATRDLAAAAAAVGDDDDEHEHERAAVRELVSTLREHWRVESRWDPGPESAGGRTLEVLDTGAGMWLVVPDGSAVELWPSTPTTVWRGLCNLLPDIGELAQA